MRDSASTVSRRDRQHASADGACSRDRIVAETVTGASIRIANGF